MHVPLFEILRPVFNLIRESVAAVSIMTVLPSTSGSELLIPASQIFCEGIQINSTVPCIHVH
jgi:hypothetical protein